MPYPHPVDFKNPNYADVFAWRMGLLAKLRADPQLLAAFKIHYKANPIDFIQDFGTTTDPRNLLAGRPALMPFILFPRQVEFLEWLLRMMAAQTPGITEKSRDVGASWLSIALSCTLCLFNEGMVIGFGSRKEEYVDLKGSPKALFWKAREFIRNLPKEFRGGWDERKHGPHKRISFPLTGSAMTGEAGDEIGRGDRTTVYFVDESAGLERPHLADASLSATTTCRIDMSSVKGRNNPFAEKRFSYPPEQVFVFDWREDPRKDEAWYEKQKRLLTAVVVAQEIDRSYDASVTGILLPREWTESCVDACAKLGIVPSGARRAALDVADRGPDLNAMADGVGVHLLGLAQWTGKEGDIFQTTVEAFRLCDAAGVGSLLYDADGLGAGVRGDAAQINERRKVNKQGPIAVEEFRGSGGVIDPDAPVDKLRAKDTPNPRTNKDYYANFKAQAWFNLRRRVELTHRAVTEGAAFDPDEVVSFDPKMPMLRDLLNELSQPTYAENTAGKMVIDKAPAGMRSPNLADSVNMFYSPRKKSRGGLSSLARVSR